MLYTATRCNTLQHTAVHCNALQHTVYGVASSLGEFLQYFCVAPFVAPAALQQQMECCTPAALQQQMVQHKNIYSSNEYCSTQTRATRYGVATISRLLKMIGLFCRTSSLFKVSFCKRAQEKRLYSAKETCNFVEPTNRSHLVTPCGMPKRSVTKSVAVFRKDPCVAVCCSVLQCVAVCGSIPKKSVFFTM